MDALQEGARRRVFAGDGRVRGCERWAGCHPGGAGKQLRHDIDRGVYTALCSRSTCNSSISYDMMGILCALHT